MLLHILNGTSNIIGSISLKYIDTIAVLTMSA